MKSKVWIGLCVFMLLAGGAIVMLIPTYLMPFVPRPMFRNEWAEEEALTMFEFTLLAEQTYFAKHGRYSTDLSALGVPVRKDAHYRYFFEDAGVGALTLFAEGNIDADATIDRWSISNVERVIDGETVDAGEPYRHVSDEAL